MTITLRQKEQILSKIVEEFSRKNDKTQKIFKEGYQNF